MINRQTRLEAHRVHQDVSGTARERLIKNSQELSGPPASFNAFEGIRYCRDWPLDRQIWLLSRVHAGSMGSQVRLESITLDTHEGWGFGRLLFDTNSHI